MHLSVCCVRLFLRLSVYFVLFFAPVGFLRSSCFVCHTIHRQTGEQTLYCFFLFPDPCHDSAYVCGLAIGRNADWKSTLQLPEKDLRKKTEVCVRMDVCVFYFIFCVCVYVCTQICECGGLCIFCFVHIFEQE